MDRGVARAILGVPSDASPHVLRRRYIALVRLWHPDRFASDPASQMLAAERLREVIGAYECLREAERDLHVMTEAAKLPAVSQDVVSQRLPPYEIEMIVRALSTTNPVDAVLGFFGWSWPVWIGTALVLQPPNHATVAPWRLVSFLLLAGVAAGLRLTSGGEYGHPWWRRHCCSPAESPLDWQKLLSGFVGLVWVGLSGSLGGTGTLLQAALSVVMPLACVWYPEEMTAGSGVSATRPVVHLVQFFGWIALAVLTFGGAFLLAANQ